MLSQQIKPGGNPLRFFALFLAASFFVAVLPSAVMAQPCIVLEDPPGTVTLPPIGCDYLSADEVHVIVDGLPPDTTIELAPIHKDFICDPGYGSCTTILPPGECEGAGGALGGNGDCFESVLEFQVTGTGDLDGFNTVIVLNAVQTEVHTGPRNPGDPVQTFPTDMFSLEANLFGDPDFASLTIRAGTAFGLPSPGETTLTDLGDGTFNVDSFFDVSYEIDFVGAPGSVLEGFGGTTQGSITMRTGEPIETGNPCEVGDNGTGTVTLPPIGCEYLSPSEVHMILDGLPVGTTVELAAIHKDFICDGQNPVATCSSPIPPGLCEVPGGSLGGNVDCSDSTAELTISGTGSLSSFSRTISVPLFMEVHTGPRTPGAQVQDFPTEMVQLLGSLFGDPDFDVLTIRAGSAYGLPPSEGRTILTDIGHGTYNVDSFFDVVYEIDYVGAPGSQLDGLSGTTQGSLRMETGNPEPNNLPALGGSWMGLFVGILAVTGSITLVALRRRTASA